MQRTSPPSTPPRPAHTRPPVHTPSAWPTSSAHPLPALAPQVLGDPELRDRYDEHGKDGLDVNFMDGAEFFNMLFGSEQFEYLIGELVIATAARWGVRGLRGTRAQRRQQGVQSRGAAGARVLEEVHV